MEILVVASGYCAVWLVRWFPMSIVFEFGQARTYLEHTCYPNRKKSLHLGYVPVPTVDKVLVHIVQDIFSTNHLVRRTLQSFRACWMPWSLKVIASISRYYIRSVNLGPCFYSGCRSILGGGCLLSRIPSPNFKGSVITKLSMKLTLCSVIGERHLSIKTQTDNFSIVLL